MEYHEDADVVDALSDEEENVKLVGAKTQKLILQTEASPFQYDKHIELIAALRASADLDQLRAARENMSSVFPLTEELWIEWFQDELPLAVLQEQKQYIITKFESAVKDYASVKVWHEYCQYTMNNIDCPADIERARNVFEQAITAVGLHVTEGSSTWDGYREFEIAILDSYQQLLDSDDDTVDMESKVETQIERIASIYKRQLSLPLLGIATVMESFENWYCQPVPSDINQNFERAQKKITLLMDYEEKLHTTEGSNLTEYLTYIDYEINSGDPARIQSIFERAIKDNCLEYDLWEKYTNYMDFQLKIPNLAVGVHKRAIRNCPWLSKFWQNYLKALERNSVDSEIYLDAFNQSLKGGFVDGESYLQLWLTRCDYHRRCINDWNSEEDKIEVLRNSFESGVTCMNHYFGLEGDKYCLLLREWAFIEAKYCENVKKSKKLWDAVLKKHSHDPSMWLEYINFLILFTDTLTVRRVFQRAVQINMEQPEVICDAFMKFERRYGTLRDVDNTQQKINLQMKQHKERCMKVSIKDNSGNQRKKRKNKFEGTGEYGNKKKKKNNEKERNSVKGDMEIEKNKQDVEQRSEQLISMGDLNSSSDFASANHSDIQKSTETEINRECEKISAQSIILDEAATSISSLDIEKITEDEMTSICSNQSAPDDMVINEKSRNSCDKDTETEENCRDVDNVDKDKSIFLSNLLFSVEEIHLRDMFTTCGEVNQIHVVKNKVGKSKGYAYLEFKERESVEAALKLDRETLLDRPVFVSPCVDTKENPTQFKFPTSLDKHTLYVSNLPFELGTEEVKQHFAQAGEIKQVRLVTNRSGKSKGYAYVEYESEVIAATAILKFDKQVLNGRPINVALSNPPTRKQNQPLKRVQEQPTQFVKSRKQEFPGSRGKAKTQISLVPRALLKTKPKEKQLSSDTIPTSESSSSTVSESPIVQATPMSNSDFRKFLLK